MKFTVITILPELVEPSLAAGVVGRAREAGTITVETINPRDFTKDKHRTVDDTPYGGGPGMVMKPEPLLAAIAAAKSSVRPTLLDVEQPRETLRDMREPRVIYMSPAGAPLTQAKVRELAQLPHLVLVCGRYEGIDERVIEEAIDEEISIGDYVLSGGELAALVVIDAVSRYVPGVLGESTSVDEESHAQGLLEYPQYTRPLKLGEREVPAILTSGNHAAIAAWRREQAIARTRARRPDLYAKFAPAVAETTAAREAAVREVAARTHLALVHHPCVDRTGAVITTALTNFDIHDLARSSMTFGLAGYHIVTPITSQRDKAAHIATLWMEDAAGEHRAHALRLVRTADAIDTVIAELTTEYGQPPLVVGTSARPDAFAGAIRRTPSELVDEARQNPAPLLLLLGTGWGLAEHLIPSVSRVLTPIEGASTWNHLSVRSAGAILLDRLFGRLATPTT